MIWRQIAAKFTPLEATPPATRVHDRLERWAIREDTQNAPRSTIFCARIGRRTLKGRRGGGRRRDQKFGRKEIG
jgi:hypothetical protein